LAVGKIDRREGAVLGGRVVEHGFLWL
jgi:hypothetical protein